MNNLLLVAIGGATGAVLRYKLGCFIIHHTANWKFPLSTFVINISGCLLAGILAGLTEKYDIFTQTQKLILFTGFLGGFTTFSAFGLETVYLIQCNELPIAILNISASIGVGILTLWIGMKIIS